MVGLANGMDLSLSKCKCFMIPNLSCSPSGYQRWTKWHSNVPFIGNSIFDSYMQMEAFRVCHLGKKTGRWYLLKTGTLFLVKRRNKYKSISSNRDTNTFIIFTMRSGSGILFRSQECGKKGLCGL